MNELPGLKSVASATAAPASASARPGGIGRPRKSALAGRSTPTTSLAASSRTPAAPVASRWSTDRAPSSIASGIAPLSVNWSPCSRSSRPAVATGQRDTAEPAPRRTRPARGRRLPPTAMLRRVGQHLGEGEVEIRVGVGLLGRDGVRPEPGRPPARGSDRAERRELGLAIEAVARLPLPGRRAVAKQPARRAGRRARGAPPRRARGSRATVERMPPPAACSSS